MRALSGPGGERLFATLGRTGEGLLHGRIPGLEPPLSSVTLSRLRHKS
jgi:hypothetical protein